MKKATGIEAYNLRRLFNDDLDRIPVSAKSQIRRRPVVSRRRKKSTRRVKK